MENVIDELKVVLRAQEENYNEVMGEGIRLLTVMDTTAAKTATRLEAVSKAWAQPQSAESFLRNELALQQAVAQHREQIEKEALRQKFATMEVESAAQWKAAEKKRQIELSRIRAEREDQKAFTAWREEQRQIQLQREEVLNKRLFGLTHTQYQIRLAELTEFYNKQRALHAGNTKALMTLDQVYFLEWRKLERMQQQEMLAGLFAKKGLLMRTVQEIAPLVGLVSGSQFGAVAGLALGSGLGAGAAIAGVFLISHAVQQIQERTQKLKELQAQYNKELEASAQHWEQIAAAQIQTTSLGQTYRQVVESTQEKVASLTQRIDELQGGKKIASGQIKELDEAKKQRDEYERILRILKTLGEREDEIQRERNRRNRDAAEEAATINAMYAGPAKDRAKLELDLAQDMRRAVEENEDALEAFDRAKRLERERMVLLNEKTPGSVDFNQFQKDTEKQRQAIVQEGEERIDSLLRIAQQRRAALLQAEQSAMRKDEHEAELAKITLQETGYRRELKLLQEKHKRELDEYHRAGWEVRNLIRRQVFEIEALKKGRDEQVQDILDNLQSRLSIARGDPGAAALAQWVELAKKLREELGLTGEEIDAIKDRFDKVMKEEANKPLREELEMLAIAAREARGEITQLQAEIEKLQKQNPNADPALVRKVAEARHMNELRKWADEQEKLLHPELRLKEYAERVKEAFEAGLLNEADAAALIRKKMAELFKTPDSGEFQSIRKFYVDPKALAARAPGQRQEDLLKQINDKMARLVALGGQGLN